MPSCLGGFRDDFLSAAELSFCHVLRSVVGDRAQICPKVALGDLFFARTGDHPQNRIATNRIDRKHVDFLVCDPKTLRPLFGIELDDSSHAREDRQKRDEFVEGVFAAAKLPLLRVPVKVGYAPSEMEALLRPHLVAGARDEFLPPSLPSDGGEGRREEARFVQNSPLLGPLPIRSSWGEEEEPRLERSLPLRHENKAAQQGHPTTEAEAAPKRSPADATKQSCPKCGGEMKLRTAKSGANVGGQFWGCGNFPKCRFVLSVMSVQ